MAKFYVCMVDYGRIGDEARTSSQTTRTDIVRDLVDGQFDDRKTGVCSLMWCRELDTETSAAPDVTDAILRSVILWAEAETVSLTQGVFDLAQGRGLIPIGYSAFTDGAFIPYQPEPVRSRLLAAE